MSSASGKLPPQGRRDGARAHPAGAGQGQLPLDRAPPGVPRLRRREDVRRRGRGRRRAPLPRPVLQRGLHRVRLADPAAAREGQGRARSSIGLDPHSHAGKALIDTLETYPRDELFHTPVDELATMAARVMETRGRRQLRIFVRRDTYGRYVSVLVFLPRDRYNTAVRERFSEILKEQLRRRVGRVHRPDERVDDGPRALRGPPAAGRGHPRRRRRRARAPAHRRLALVARRLHRRHHHGVRRGRRVAARAHLRGVVPRGLQGGLLGGHRRARPRPARGARRGRHRPVAVLAARRRPRRGAAQGLPARRADLAVRGAAGAVVDGRRGRRRAALPARPRRPPVVHLRVRAALRPRHARPHARGVPGHHPRGVGRLQRDRRLQRARARRPA